MTGPGDPITYIDDTVSHTGIIWSDGPRASTVWVLPDHNPANAVLVRLPTSMRAKRGDGPCADHGSPATWQRDTIRRCDNLRTRAGLYRTVCPPSRYGSDGHAEHVHHADSDCPDAVGLERLNAVYGRNEVIDLLLSQRPIHAKFCNRCIYLDPAITEIAA